MIPVPETGKQAQGCSELLKVTGQPARPGQPVTDVLTPRALCPGAQDVLAERLSREVPRVPGCHLPAERRI